MTDDADQNAGPRPPSLLDALLPVAVLIALIALTIALFGISATDGPLQVALLLSAAFAALVALKNGYTSAAIADAAIGGVTTAMSAIFILLAVGALIGTWNMAGTIPTVVDYGVQLLNPTIFYVTTAIVCAVVGTVTGSSWTTAGTLGVAFVGDRKSTRLNSSHMSISYAVFCLKKKNKIGNLNMMQLHRVRAKIQNSNRSDQEVSDFFTYLVFPCHAPRTSELTCLASNVRHYAW